MNFSRKSPREEPEINFIPLIDLLLVILIFLMVTTTYNRMNGISVELPQSSDAQSTTTHSEDILITVHENNWTINQQIINSSESLHHHLQSMATNKESWVIIYADGQINYQKIVDTMNIASRAGHYKITLATQKTQ